MNGFRSLPLLRSKTSVCDGSHKTRVRRAALDFQRSSAPRVGKLFRVFLNTLRHVTRSSCSLPGIASAAFCVAACAEQPRLYSSGELSERTVVFQDNFERDTLGPNWFVTSPMGDEKNLERVGSVRIESGRLVLQGRRNFPVWLRTPHFDEFEIEFDAWPQSSEGDVKFEIAGDGESYARTARYRASGYVLIFGGWNGTMHVLARQDEHGDERMTRSVSGVDQGRRYHFKIRRQGGTIQWYVDGRPLLTMVDKSPLNGHKHRYFAFNNWNAEVHFDNLVISRPTSHHDSTQIPQ